MSQTPTISQPPEPLTPTPSRQPPPPGSAAAQLVLEASARFRAEIAGTSSPERQARLWMELADLEECAGDEPSAARDYLASFNADQTFREPLEALVRLLEKRRSQKNLGRLIDALVRVAATPDEKVRALLARAAYQAEQSDQRAAAEASAREATRVEGAPAAERASTWLALEVAAGIAGDAATREEALAERTAFAGDPTWRALLLCDRARLAATSDFARATTLLAEARDAESGATWAATALLEQLTAERAAAPGTEDAAACGEAHADALAAMATLVDRAIADGARGDALGVPRWARQPARAVEAWLREAEARRAIGQMDKARAGLDRAAAAASALDGAEARRAEATVLEARWRIAEQTGDRAAAAELAEKRLASIDDDGEKSALALSVARQAAARGDTAGAIEALGKAVASDPGSLPARAMQLDLLADSGDPALFAAQLEAFADRLATDEGRGRAFLLAAYAWAAQAKDVAGAKTALSQAALCGVPPPTVARMARALASIADDAGWYEEATKRLLASGAEEREALSLYVELVRLRHARGDAEGEAKALRDLAAAPIGAWLGRVLEGFLPDAPGDGAARGRRRAAVEELAALEKDPELARGLSVIAALRAMAEGDTAAARQRLAEVTDREPSDVLVGALLGDVHRAAGDPRAAANTALRLAAATSDADLGAALRIEAAFEQWRAGDRKSALASLEAAAQAAPTAAKVALAWAARGVDVDSIEGRRTAIERALDGEAAEASALDLERFGLELAAQDPDAALAALARAEGAAQGDLAVAAALARLVGPRTADDATATSDAIARLAAQGPRAQALAAAERTRLAREGGDLSELAQAARSWFEVGGGLPAAIEWLGAAVALREAQEEVQARLAVAALLSGEARDEALASAALARWAADPAAAAPIVVGDSDAARLMNLELGPPGCDPRRRTRALSGLDGALGDNAGVDASSLAGWSALAGGDLDRARTAFEAATNARPDDLAAWEGLRACAEALGEGATRARAAAELGGRCKHAARSAAFWEEAALLMVGLGDEAGADQAFEESFNRDPTRAVAFDKLFRRVRARKENDKLLALIARRLDVAEETSEIQKLFWEQARVLREKGDQDGALKALEHVTMLDPDHVGALALLGEINIRREHFEEAATSLARLAMLDDAPARNRVTAGVAAVDLYENKLERHDKALEVLLCLYRAKLSTLPVRERLARAAARTGAWNEATAMLEQLMNERAEKAGRIEAARLAMGIHKDRLGKPQSAVAAATKLLEESPADGEALDLVLETQQPAEVRRRLLEGAHRALVEALQTKPTDVAALRRLCAVARGTGDDALQQATLGALAALGAADPKGLQAFAKLAGQKPRSPQIAIGRETFVALLAPGDEGPLAELFQVLGPTLAEALGPTLAAIGVGRRERVDPRGGAALRNEIAAWAGAFGLNEFELYVGGAASLGVQGVPGAPPALVVGPGIQSPLTPLARARVARELLAIRQGTTLVRLRDDLTVAAIAVASCKLVEVPIQHPPYAVLAEVERALGKTIARRTRKLLPEICRAIAAGGLDARAWSKRAVASQDRVGLIASGEPAVVLSEVLHTSPENLPGVIDGSARAEELLRFVLSARYLELRRTLGLEGGGGS